MDRNAITNRNDTTDRNKKSSKDHLHAVLSDPDELKTHSGKQTIPRTDSHELEATTSPSPSRKRNYNTYLSDTSHDHAVSVARSSKPKLQHEYRSQQDMYLEELDRLDQDIHSVEEELAFCHAELAWTRSPVFAMCYAGYTLFGMHPSAGAGAVKDMAYGYAQRSAGEQEIRLSERIGWLLREKAALEAERADVKGEYERMRREDSMELEKGCVGPVCGLCGQPISAAGTISQ